MHYKDYQAEFKSFEEGTRGEFEALISVFDNVDLQGDRIKKGAFDKSLEKWRKSGDPIPVVLAHQWDNVYAHIGTADPHEVKATSRGLLAKGVLDVDDNPVAAQVYKLMKRRSLKQFSFGYAIPEGGEKRAKDGAWDLTELDIIELGPCLKGANPETELLAVKSALSEVKDSRNHTATIEDVVRIVSRLENLVTDLVGTKSQESDGLKDGDNEDPEGQVEPQDAELNIYLAEIELYEMPLERQE